MHRQRPNKVAWWHGGMLGGGAGSTGKRALAFALVTVVVLRDAKQLQLKGLKHAAILIHDCL